MQTTFYGLKIEYDERVLRPYPDAELTVFAAIEALGLIEGRNVCEIGVGSGNITAAILKNVPDAVMTAVDIDPNALDVARQNFRKHRLMRRVRLVESDMLAAVDGKFDLIVSCPPYFSKEQSDALDCFIGPEVSYRGGATGFEMTQRVIDTAVKYLNPGGYLVLEVQNDECQATVMQMLSKWRTVEPFSLRGKTARAVRAKYGN